jgi:hypothetical protein
MPRFLIGAMPNIVFVSFMQFRGVTWDWEHVCADVCADSKP